MQRLKELWLIVLAISMLLPIESLYAQMAGKKSLPHMPVTYPGDTDDTIMRRSQWIAGAKKEGTLVWWGTLTPKEGSQVIAEFNKFYPFVKVNYWRGKGEEVASKLDVENAAGHATCDIALGGETHNYPRWRKLGMLGKFADIMPGIKAIDKRMYSKYGDWALAGNNAITPQYNTKQVSAAEAPKTWDDLLNPKWKGQIALTTDMKIWNAMAVEEGGWGIEKTEGFLRKLKQQQPIWAASHTAGHSLLIAGEYKILGEAYWYHVRRSIEKGAPVDWVRVKPVPITGSSFHMQKNAPHPNAAKLFLEWQFSHQGLITYEALIGKGSPFPGSGTRLAKALEGLPLVIRTEEGEQKTIDMGLDKRFADIFGVTSGD